VEESRANAVVAALRARNVMAHVHRGGVYQFGVRVVIGDGREAIWDSDNTASIEAQIMRDGMLVGFVPRVPGSEDLDDAGVVALIAGTDYDAPVVPQSRPREPTTPRSAGRSPRTSSRPTAGVRPGQGRGGAISRFLGRGR
jgi:hypothetical protein